MWNGKPTALAALLISAFCAPLAAQTAGDDEARAQFDTGVELFEDGQFAQASVAFARAYELRPSYKILYLVGKCENAQGHFAASLDAFTRYLAEGGAQIEAARQQEVRQEIARLNSRVGMVEIAVDTAGIAVYVDERKSGITPLSAPVFVDLGEHEIRLKRGAAELHSEIVKVAGGQLVTVKIEIEDGADTRVVTAGNPPAQTPASQAAVAPAAQKPKRLWTWVAMGVGGAAAIGAAITGGLTLSRADDVKSDCEGNLCDTSIEDEADAARTLAYTTDALVAVAGVGIAAGIVLFFVEPKWKKSEAAAEIAPVAVPLSGGGALALTGRF